MKVTRVVLDPHDEEYMEVTKLFNRSRSTKQFYFSIEGIEKVYNGELLQKFERRRMEYVDRYGHVQVVKLFHGTSKRNIPSILKSNLEVQRHGQNIGHRFGAGVSFSALASYASHYCDKFQMDNEMLVCNVLISNIVAVPERKNRRQPVLTQPPLLEGHSYLRYDTTAKNKTSMDVIVKFEDHTFHPAFVVHFKRVSKLPPSSFILPLVESHVSNMPRPPQPQALCPPMMRSNSLVTGVHRDVPFSNHNFHNSSVLKATVEEPDSMMLPPSRNMNFAQPNIPLPLSKPSTPSLTASNVINSQPPRVLCSSSTRVHSLPRPQQNVLVPAPKPIMHWPNTAVNAQPSRGRPSSCITVSAPAPHIAPVPSRNLTNHHSERAHPAVVSSIRPRNEKGTDPTFLDSILSLFQCMFCCVRKRNRGYLSE